ncbi:MAG: DegT/DnrJ/EryC1/StrS family aminotransferase [Candidatus Marinimicrobia bacterium]|nr:DegT/DnrJ/EryC1/StrS family aminotransferase [Candidatus Neomarinimicrobiota bacterium]
METIDWYKFSLWGKEKKYVRQALDSTWVSGGEYVNRFESAFASHLGLTNAYAVNNGTAALQLAFLAIKIEPGDEVIVPSFGFMAAANVLKLMHAIPVFVDVKEDDWCINENKVQEKITNKTKAIVTIHNYGVVSNVLQLQNIARENDIYLIEDCAESIFSKQGEVYSGNYGDLSTFSFHATKTISTGEGGLISCRNEELKDRIELIRSHGLRRGKKHYWHEYYGNNYRMSNILAAIGLAQLEKIYDIVGEKQRVYDTYRAKLQHLPQIKFQSYPIDTSPVIWAVAISLQIENVVTRRDGFLENLMDQGIECRPGFYTANQLNLSYGSNKNDFMVADKCASSIIVLPSFPQLTETQINKVSQSLLALLEE